MSGLITLGIGFGGTIEQFILFGLGVGAPEVEIVPAIGKKRKKLRVVYKPIPEEIRQKELEQQLAAAARRLADNRGSVQAAHEKLGTQAATRATRERLKKLLDD